MGQKEGRGTLQKGDYTYKGEFFNGMKHGMGEEDETSINWHYKGTYKYGKRHGTGR